MTAYDAAEWSDLFVASAGASAALAGLVFVAVSINVERILEFKGLPERALETLMLLVGVLLISLIGLVPGLSDEALGAMLLAEAVLVGAVIWRLPWGETEGDPAAARTRVAGRLVIRTLGTLPFALGGLSALAGEGGGLYWIAAGIILAIFGAVVSAWVLLIEIRR
jgi:modulator of FtsH protease